LDARHARHGEALEAGTIYIAPPDHHLLVRNGAARLARGAQENGHRPAIDPLFRAAAREFAAGTIAVILSGSRDDGAAGVAAVAAQGGNVIVQDPADAFIDSMPKKAIAANHPEFVVPVKEIAAVIARLTARPAPDGPANDMKEADVEERYAELDLDVIEDESPGESRGACASAATAAAPRTTSGKR